MRGPDSGCESLPGFGCPAAKNFVCHEAAAGERRSPRRDPPPRGRLSGHLPRPALAAAYPGWRGLCRAHDSEAATDYAVNPVNLSQKASHDRGPHPYRRPRTRSVRPADRHRGRRWAHGSAAAWPRRPRLGAGHRRMPVGYHASPGRFILAGTAPGRGQAGPSKKRAIAAGSRSLRIVQTEEP